ncbi:MAG: rhodanese-like domain-containing protein [Mucilaginibacter polytrichastri]|nr:rhodanese-like domain-containing protein [Mucilaginibacter polytrichastri]
MLFLVKDAAAQDIDPDYKHYIDSLYIKHSSHISPSEVAAMKNVYILDAREEEEFAVSHLKNARNIGYIWFDMRRIYDIPLDGEVVIYCTAGWRSERIAERLQKAGYTHIYNLYGGIFEWINEGYPVYRSNGTQTTEIHTYTASLAHWVNRGTKVH